MVGIVLISHSSSLAAGAAELVGQIAGGARVVPAGGTEDGQLGTSSRLIGEAIAKADQGAGVLLIPDLGSAVLTARSVLAELDADGPAVAPPHAPLIEGAGAAGGGPPPPPRPPRGAPPRRGGGAAPPRP